MACKAGGMGVEPKASNQMIAISTNTYPAARKAWLNFFR
jgi:hypothetical protein